ncbi:YihY family inner membrane protein [Limnohabitans sp.]|jgi:membrane protein|uniref:YihY family inner membrane protein n=1 Tax=Limnohabitans sp. TaxID=1907725 RepID=UPI0039BCF613|nr:YihY family inner membrane protein [Comamonadaceae bacterium]
MPSSLNKTSLRDHTGLWWQEVSVFPWRQMGAVLAERFRDARLGVSASSLTFTTVLAMVPLFAVGLAVFSAFPVFGKFQDTIQRWLIESLVPESIARQVLSYLSQFSLKASRLGTAGLVAVLVSAVFLMVTIERTLGQIWRLQRQRPLPQRVLLYWSAITLGPLLLGSSLAATSFVVSASRDVVNVLPGSTRWLLDGFEFLMLTACVSGLYFYVPYTRVRWRHAITAGFLVSGSLEVAKKLMAFYLLEVPTYSLVYGAFAAVPILLVWIYVTWLLVLLGAVLASSLPELGRQAWRKPEGAGWSFRLALEVLAELNTAKVTERRGRSVDELAALLRVETDELRQVLAVLQGLDWVGRLSEQNDLGQARLVLLVDPAMASVAPLADRLLVLRGSATDPLWLQTGLDQIRLVQLFKN